jgi:OmpA-OmpF porin, OOP family
MKLSYKIVFLILTSFLTCSKIIAQTPDTARVASYHFKAFAMDNIFRTWSVGANFGLLSYGNVLQKNASLDFTSPSSKIGYDIYVKKQIFPILGIQADVLAGSLSAANSQQTTYGDPNYLNENTKLNYAASVNFIFSFAGLNWHYNTLGVQPFVGVGVGLMSYHPKLYGIDAVDTGFIHTDAGTATSVFIPAQIGLKLNVSRSVNIDLSYRVNFAMSDKVDGNIYSSTNDKFSYVNLGLEFALGKRSKIQMATYGTVPMRYAHLPVKKDRSKQGNIAANKVPAADTVKVSKIETPPNHNELNKRLLALSMDSDSDGVSDYFDRCPNTPKGVVVDNSGCPIVEITGKTHAAATESEKQVILDVAKNIEFEIGRSSITKASLPALDQLLNLLIVKKMNTDLPLQILIISGSANDFNSELANLSLSRDRAEAIKTFLVKKGIKPLNIVTVGYGNEKPANSKAGVNSGRKVEFTLY